MATKHTQFRLDLEMARAEALAADWTEAHIRGLPVAEIEAALDRAIRATRQTESYLRKKARHAS